MTCLSYRLSLTEIRAFEAGRSSRAALKECHLTKDGSSWFVKKVSLPPFDVEIFEVVKRKGLEAITPEFYFDVSQVCYSSSFSRSTFFFISYFHQTGIFFSLFICLQYFSVIASMAQEAKEVNTEVERLRAQIELAYKRLDLSSLSLGG